MILKVFARVFRHVRYSVGAALVAITALSMAVLVPNLSTIGAVVGSEAVSWYSKGVFILSLYGSLLTNFTWWSALSVLVISVLFGINIAFLTYYIRRRQAKLTDRRAHLASLSGIVSAVLGIGCAACGSVVITTVLSLFGAGGALLLLPLRGAEFSLLAIGLLGFSIQYLAKRINDPLVCPSHQDPRP